MKYELKNINWIDCIFIPTDSNSTTIEIWVKAGSNYETKEENWISHLLEHMLFKWWKKYKTPKEVSEIIDNIWWEMNAYTSREKTWYYIKTASEYIETSIDVLSDIFVYPNFDKKELEKEKLVVLQELKMWQDDPYKLLYNKFMWYYYWNSNAYWRTIIWTEKNIKNFTQEDLIKYKNSLYTKDNIVIVVSWKIDNQVKLEKMIKEKFNDLPKNKTKEKQKFKWINAKKHKDFYKKWLEQNHLIMWIPSFSVKNNNSYIVDLIWVILWWNMSSILFQEVREKLWLCYYIWSSNYTNQEDWILLINAWIDKNNFDKWIKKINEILDNFQNWNITIEQLEKAKNYLIWSSKIWLETSNSIAWYMINSYINNNWKIETIEEYIEKIKKISLIDIKNISRKIFWKENRYLYYLD